MENGTLLGREVWHTCNWNYIRRGESEWGRKEYLKTERPKFPQISLNISIYRLKVFNKNQVECTWKRPFQGALQSQIRRVNLKCNKRKITHYMQEDKNLTDDFSPKITEAKRSGQHHEMLKEKSHPRIFLSKNISFKNEG